MSNPCYTVPRLRFAYELRYHIGFQTYRHRPLFAAPTVRSELAETLRKVCGKAGYHLLEYEIEDCWLRSMLSLRPEHAPSKAVQTLKSNISRWLSTPPRTVDPLWGRGFYVRSVGNVTAATVQAYLARQAEHHEGTSRLLAEYRHPCPAPYLELRPCAHCMAEFNCHLVFCPVRRQPIVDPDLAEPLTNYLLGVGQAREFVTLSLSVLNDHIHLLAALPPKMSPGDCAATVMNNSAHWFETRQPGALRLWNVTALWEDAAFLGTAGRVTSGHVANYLRMEK